MKGNIKKNWSDCRSKEERAQANRRVRKAGKSACVDALADAVIAQKNSR